MQLPLARLQDNTDPEDGEESPSALEPCMELWAVVITALISPLFLKLTEFVLNKSSQKERERAEKDKQTDARIQALGKRVDELRDSNIKLSLQSETQQKTINEQAAQIVELKASNEELRKEITQRDQRILELGIQVEVLTAEARHATDGS